jgi:hypothetical protein
MSAGKQNRDRIPRQHEIRGILDQLHRSHRMGEMDTNEYLHRYKLLVEEYESLKGTKSKT